jgi:5'-nucleotidase
MLCAAARAQDFQLKIIAFNDFHGNLESPGKSRANLQSPLVPVGGVDYLAGYVAHLKSENPLNIVVSAGDLTGASPLVSALFHDEGTIETMNRLGLELNAVGNHEFDKGMQELRRKQHGGCFPGDRNTCEGAAVGTPVPFEGAKFQYLAANVLDEKTGKTIFPGYAIKTFNGVKVAFIGLTLKDTPTIVIAKNVAGLRFTDEADAINGIVRKLKPQGVNIFVVLVHQGGFQKPGDDTADINTCQGGLKGYPIEGIVNRLDDAVDLLLSAHTHVAYNCSLPNSVGRRIPVTQASAFGRMLTDADLTIDPRTKTATAVTVRNILVDRTDPQIQPDPTLQRIVERYSALAAPIIDRVEGSISAESAKPINAAGESAMGDLIADAQLEATHTTPARAQIALMNEGGVRTGLRFVSGAPGVPAGKVTYGELVTAQPFGNDLVTMTLTGSQIQILLEEQFKGCALGAAPGDDVPQSDRRLEVSAGFTYAWHADSPPCHRIDPQSIRFNGAPVTPHGRYRVTVNSLMAEGGEQLYVLKQGTDRVVGMQDVDAMTAYFAKHAIVSPPSQGRIHVSP